MADFYLGVGDLLPELTATLKDADGALVPLDSGSPTVDFVMRVRASTVIKVDHAATVVNAAGAEVKYAWNPGDTDTPGAYEGRFVVTFPGAKPMSFPNDEHLHIMITGA